MLTIGKLVMAAIRSFMVVPGTNTSRTKNFSDSDDFRKEVADLVPGWNPTLGTIQLRKADPATAKEDFAKFKESVLSEVGDGLEIALPGEKVEKVKILRSDVLDMFAEVYGNKLPDFAVNAGHRRGTALIVALTTIKRTGNDPYLEVPAQILPDGLSKLDLEILNVGENRQRGTAKAMSELDNLRMAFRLFEASGSESALMKPPILLARGSAQKYWAGARCIGVLTDAKDVKTLDALWAGKYTVKSFDKEKLRTLASGGDAAEIREYFANPGGENRAKIMSRKDIEALLNHKNHVVRHTAAAILLNKAATLDPLYDSAKEFNELYAAKCGDIKKVTSTVDVD